MRAQLTPFALLCLTACGTTAAPATSAIEDAHHQAAGPVELSLRTGNGDYLDIGDLRDAPTLIFVFTTYDEFSQATMLSVTHFRRMHPDIHIVGIAAQPTPAPMLDPYATATGATFPLTYDPTDKLLHGETGLGAITDIPTLFVLDRTGRIRARRGGYATERNIERMFDSLTP